VVGEHHKDARQRPWSSNTHWAYGLWIIADVSPYGDSFHVRYPEECSTRYPNSNPCFQSAWLAYHPGIINWLLCDGSVRAISETTDAELMCELATIAGYEATQLP